jgi:hypothetical protein
VWEKSTAKPVQMHLLGVLGLVWAGAGAVAAEGKSIRNLVYNRRIAVTNLIVREEHLITAKLASEATDANGAPWVSEILAREIQEKWAPSYVVVVEAERAASLASFAAFLMASSKPEPVDIHNVTDEIESCKQLGHVCLSVNVQLQEDQPTDLVVAMTFTKAVSIEPLTANDQLSKFRQVVTIPSWQPVSAYSISGKSATVFRLNEHASKAKLTCPLGMRPQMLDSASQPEIQGLTCTHQADAVLTVEQKKSPVTLSLLSKDVSLLRVAKLKRSLTFLPWTQRVQIADHYEIAHDGFVTPNFPKFSRFDMARQLSDVSGAYSDRQIEMAFPALIPASARTLQLRDEVGLIYSELKRVSRYEDVDLVHLPFRYPLIGGLSVNLDFYYNVPYDLFISRLASQESPFKQELYMQLYPSASDYVIDELEIELNLPEDAADIEYELETQRLVQFSKLRYRTYLSTLGENRLRLRFVNMTQDQLMKTLRVTFDYPWWAVLRKPAVLVSLLVLLVISIMRFAHTRLSWTSQVPNKPQGNVRAQLKRLFSKRREMLRSLEDMMTTFMHVSSLPAAEKQAEQDRRHGINEHVKKFEDAIFVKVKESSSRRDAQLRTLDSIALKQLYSEQLALINRIIEEAAGAGGLPGVDSSTGSSSMTMSSAGSLDGMRDGAYSKSASSGNPFARRRANVVANAQINALATEAVDLDGRIVAFEAKLLV